MLITILWVLGIILALYLGLLVLVAYGCLHPIRVPIFLSPGALGLPQRSVQVTTEDDVLLRGWWIDHPNPKSVVVLAHGYLMNRAEPIPLAKRLYEEGLACLVFDFRAHGVSGGRLSSVGPHEKNDVLAMVQHARAEYPDKPIWIWGSSMGGAATVLATEAMEVRPDALVLDSPYSSLIRANEGWWRTFAGKFWPFLVPVWMFCWLMTRVDPRKVRIDHELSKMPEIPVLLMIGDCDVIVPLNEARKIADASENCRMELFEGCQHSQARWFHPVEYDERLFRFLKEQNLI